MDWYNTVVNFFKDGGFFLYPLVIIFVVGVAIALERWFFLTKETIKNRNLWDEVAPHLGAGNFKAAIQLAEHAFWRGRLWDRPVALQGDSTFTKYDFFEVSGDELLYWGTFRGNGYYGSEECHSFASPFVWLDRVMWIGDFKQQRVAVYQVQDGRWVPVASADDQGKLQPYKR